MALAPYKIRTIGNACITRYDSGERTLDDIVDYYNLAPEDEQAVYTHIYDKRPDLRPVEPAPEPTPEPPTEPATTDSPA